MVWDKDFRASAVVSHTSADGSALVVRGLTDVSIRAGGDVRKEVASGSIYPDNAHLDALTPQGSFTTYDLKAALAAFGLYKCITADVSHPGFLVYGQKQTCAGVASGSVHDQYQIRAGIVVARTLQVDHRGNASLTYDFYAGYDGTNAPVVRNASVALPTAASARTPRFSMYSLQLNGVTMDGKRSISIDFAPSVTFEGADSEVYNSVVSLSSMMPRWTIRGVNPAWLTTVSGLTGVSAPYASSYLKLKNRNAAVEAASHIIVNTVGLVSWDTVFDGSIASPAGVTVNVDSYFDGTNAPVVCAVDQILES